MYKSAAAIATVEKLIGEAIQAGLDYKDKLDADYLIQCISLDKTLSTNKKSSKILTTTIGDVEKNSIMYLRGKLGLEIDVSKMRYVRVYVKMFTDKCKYLLLWLIESGVANVLGKIVRVVKTVLQLAKSIVSVVTWFTGSQDSDIVKSINKYTDIAVDTLEFADTIITGTKRYLIMKNIIKFLSSNIIQPIIYSIKHKEVNAKLVKVIVTAALLFIFPAHAVSAFAIKYVA